MPGSDAGTLALRLRLKRKPFWLFCLIAPIPECLHSIYSKRIKCLHFDSFTAPNLRRCKRMIPQLIRAHTIKRSCRNEKAHFCMTFCLMIHDRMKKRLVHAACSGCCHRLSAKLCQIFLLQGCPSHQRGAFSVLERKAR